ncbi:dipeptidase PepV [Cohnella soli]|uniref:Dipeptidase PepV n=1 Tax=Cohnella soli TaxID=425005 RepID=A0ABW0HTB8_9BACL
MTRRDGSVINWNDEAERRQEALLRDLSSLLAIPSVKDPATVGPGQPLGEASARALAHMLVLAEREGLRTETIDGIVGYAEFAYGGEYGGGNDSLTDDASNGGYVAVLCHVDVVPASGEWTSPPFEATIRDGRLYARGALDDKGPAIAALYGLLIVKELGLPLRHRVRLIVGTDEETGMNCMEAYNRKEPPPLFGFTPDADFPIVHAEKGQVNTRMTLRFNRAAAGDARMGRFELAAFQSGTAANMVPDRAEATVRGDPHALGALTADYAYFCLRRGLDGSSTPLANGSLLFRMNGVSAHGMMPEAGVNAGLKLLEFLAAHPFAGNGGRFIRGAFELLAGDTRGEALGIACADDVTGPLTVTVGLLNYDPETEEGCFHLNIRYPACGGNGEWIVDTLRKRLEPYGFVLTPPTLKSPHQVPAAHLMIQTLQGVYAEETGMEATLLSTGGGTYACKLANCVAFGPLFPGEPDTAHQPDESIGVASLLKATAIYARAIYELANLDELG